MVVITQCIGKPRDYLDWNPSPPVSEDSFKRTLKQGLGMSLDELRELQGKVIMLSIKTMLGKVLLLFIISTVIPSAKFSVKFGDYILEQTTVNSKVTNQISRKINFFN